MVFLNFILSYFLPWYRAQYSAFWMLSTAEDMVALLNTSTPWILKIFPHQEKKLWGKYQNQQNPGRSQEKYNKWLPGVWKQGPHTPQQEGMPLLPLPAKAQGGAQLVSHRPPTRAWGESCCRTGPAVSSRINVVLSDSFPTQCLLGNIKASGIVGVPKCLNSEN